MPEEFLLHKADCVSGTDCISRLHEWGELPFPGLRQWIDIDAAFKEKSALFCKFWQWVLETVEYLAEHPRAEFDREEFTGELDVFPDSQPPGIFVNLHLGKVPTDPDNLRFETFFSVQDEGNLVLHDRRIKCCSHHVPAYLCDPAYPFRGHLSPWQSEDVFKHAARISLPDILPSDENQQLVCIGYQQVNIKMMPGRDMIEGFPALLVDGTLGLKE